MKLIIDISETDYNTYKHFGDKGSYTERIIANGAPYKQDERPKGKWIIKRANGCNYYICSECKLLFNDWDNFCPNCGADMRGENT